MNEHPQQTPVNDEINLSSFFEYFSRFFKWLKNIFIYFFKGLFWLFIFKPYIYYKKHKKLILSFTLIALIAGFVFDSLSIKRYSAEILVSPNYDSGKELYTTIDYLNSLINENKITDLAKTLQVDTSIAKSYREFSIKPNYNERILIRNFDEFHNMIDTAVLKNINFESYKKSFQDQKFDYPQHIITVISDNPDAFYPLNNYFNNFLNDNEVFGKRKETTVNIIQNKINIIQKSIAQIDSLRKSIDLAIQHMGQSNIPNQSVIVGGNQIQFPEKKYDLFGKKERLAKILGALKSGLVEKSHIIILNSLFPKTGKLYNPIYMQMKFILPISILIIFFTIFLLIDLFHYLDKLYLKSKNNNSSKQTNA